MAKTNGNRTREPPDKGRAGTPGKRGGDGAAKTEQGKIFHRVKELRQAVKKGRQFEIRKMCRRVKETEKRAANLGAAAAGMPVSGKTKDGKRGGTAAAPEDRDGSTLEHQKDNEKLIMTAVAATRQLEKLKQKLQALRAVAVDDVVKHACISAGLPKPEAEDMVIQLQKYIEKLLAGGGVKGNISKQEEHRDNPTDTGCGLADTAEHTWAMDRLLNTKCVEDEVLILRDTITHARLGEEEEVRGTGEERPKVQKRKALDEEVVEGAVKPGSVPVVKRKKVVKFDDSPTEDREGIDDPERRGGGLPQKRVAVQGPKQSKGTESESDVEGMDKEMAGMAIAKLQSANLSRRRQKRQKKVLSSEEEEEEDVGQREEEEAMEQGDESETDSGVISASDADKGKTSEEEGEDVSDERSGRSQSEDEDNNFSHSTDGETDDDDGDNQSSPKPHHKVFGEDRMLLGKERNKEDGSTGREGRNLETTGVMDRSGRENKSRKDLRGSEGGGKGKESQRQTVAAKARARLEVKLKRRLLRTTKAGGNRLGQRERRRLAEMILGEKARHLTETSTPAGQLQYRQPCRPSEQNLSSMKGVKGRELSAAAVAAAVATGSSHVKRGRQKTGGSMPGASRGKVGRVERKSGGTGGVFAQRSSDGVPQKKGQMTAQGVSDERRLPAKSREKNEPEKKDKKLHPSWIAKIEQQKKAVQLNVAAGKKIKFDDDDDD